MFGESFESNSTEFKPVPKGRYACKLDNCTIEETKSEKKTPYLNLSFSIVEAGEYAALNNRKLWVKLWMTPKAYDMTSQQLDNIYVFKTIGKHSTIESFQQAAADKVFALVGKKFEVAVTGHDEFNGKTYENTFLSGYIDTPNTSVQTMDAAGIPRPTTIDAEEPLPF